MRDYTVFITPIKNWYLSYNNYVGQSVDFRQLKVIKPRHVHEGYSSHCVGVCVCYCASCYIPGLPYVQSEVAYSFLYSYAFKDMYCVDYSTLLIVCTIDDALYVN